MASRPLTDTVGG
uniref:Uncharacterized protein n=1 Tax=Anguilla anguilla TaxID=7936 RepID=A0A0E9V011_ANGAN